MRFFQNRYNLKRRPGYRPVLVPCAEVWLYDRLPFPTSSLSGDTGWNPTIHRKLIMPKRIRIKTIAMERPPRTTERLRRNESVNRSGRGIETVHFTLEGHPSSFDRKFCRGTRCTRDQAAIISKSNRARKSSRITLTRRFRRSASASDHACAGA
jgi:hypothetical protein